MNLWKMARGDVFALREGAAEEQQRGNPLQAALLLFLAGERGRALVLAASENSDYPLMETGRGRFKDRLVAAKSYRDFATLSRYYFGAEADVKQFLANQGTSGASLG